MADIKVLHTGDGHIDTDHHGATINPETGINRAWESNQRALASAVRHAIENEVDLFVHAGDGFKGGKPSQEALLMFVETLRPLMDAGIATVLLDGNHDRHTVPSSQRTATYTAAQILGYSGEAYCVDRASELIRTKSGIQVACLPWLSKSTILTQLGMERVDPAEGDTIVRDFGLSALDDMYAEADHSSPLIVASHVTVDDVNIEHLSKGHKRGSEVDISHIFSEPIIPRAALQDGPASYVALSHIHARQKMGTKCYYAGSPNRITFTDADDPKSVNLVKITDGNELAAVDYLDTDARIMTSISLVDPDAEKRLDALEEGALVRLVLPPGEPDAPDSVRAAIREAGAILATTQTTPQDRPRLTATTLPEKISPLSALDSWLDERAPDVDRAYVKDLATRIAEQVEHP